MCLILFDAVRACSVGVLHIAGTSNLGFGGGLAQTWFPRIIGTSNLGFGGGPGPDLVSPYYRD